MCGPEPRARAPGAVSQFYKHLTNEGWRNDKIRAASRYNSYNMDGSPLLTRSTFDPGISFFDSLLCDECVGLPVKSLNWQATALAYLCVLLT